MQWVHSVHSHNLDLNDKEKSGDHPDPILHTSYSLVNDSLPIFNLYQPVGCQAPNSIKLQNQECGADGIAVNEDWKQPLMFLKNYGYDMDKLVPKSRIRVIHENSLTSVGGRSAPFVLFLNIIISRHIIC